jgi:hypothetical protein
MVSTSSSQHSDGKPLPMRLLDPFPRTGEMLPGGATLPCAAGAKRPRVSSLRRRAGAHS